MARDGGYCNCCGKHRIRSNMNETSCNKPYLIIEFETHNSEPKVIYKGKEVKFKDSFKLEYGIEPMPSMVFDMTYHDVTEERPGVLRSITDRTAGKWDYKRSD